TVIVEWLIADIKGVIFCVEDMIDVKVSIAVNGVGVAKCFDGRRLNGAECIDYIDEALRAAKDTTINSDGKNAVPDVWQLLDKIKEFSDKFRNGSWVEATRKALTNVIAIGICGSFLGTLFVHTALRTCELL
nr:glucose-6-phosphate isomerase, cytosolic [Tanacetum cinerariifolium]